MGGSRRERTDLGGGDERRVKHASGETEGDLQRVLDGWLAGPITGRASNKSQLGVIRRDVEMSHVSRLTSHGTTSLDKLTLI